MSLAASKEPSRLEGLAFVIPALLALLLATPPAGAPPCRTGVVVVGELRPAASLTAALEAQLGGSGHALYEQQRLDAVQAFLAPHGKVDDAFAAGLRAEARLGLVLLLDTRVDGAAVRVRIVLADEAGVRADFRTLDRAALAADPAKAAALLLAGVKPPTCAPVRPAPEGS